MTDALPHDAQTEEVRATIADLQPGLAALPRGKAVSRIDHWHRLLSTSDRNDLRQIAEDLSALKSHLLGPEIDAETIGATLTRLGEQTAAAAERAEHNEVGLAVRRLGHLLLHAGHALRGPRPVPSS